MCVISQILKKRFNFCKHTVSGTERSIRGTAERKAEGENMQVHMRLWVAITMRTKGGTVSPRNEEQTNEKLYPEKTPINRLIKTSKRQSR